MNTVNGVISSSTGFSRDVAGNVINSATGSVTSTTRATGGILSDTVLGISNIGNGIINLAGDIVGGDK